MTRSGKFAGEVLVGSRGWEHDDWTGHFYPGDLPEDWRLTYYANAFRSVLVPADRLLHVVADEVEQWREEVPDDFLFYPEISPDLMASMDSARFLSLLDLLRDGVGGISIRLSAKPWPTWEQLDPWLAALSGRYPLVATLHGDQAPEDLQQTLARWGVSASWRAGVVPWTETRGCMGFLDPSAGNLRGLRDHVQAFIAWVTACERALLCFEANADTCDTMEHARVIAELVGS